MNKTIFALSIIIVFIVGSIIIGSMEYGYGQTALHDESSVIVYSNTQWTGEYGREG